MPPESDFAGYDGPDLFLVRHGQTDWNKLGWFQGSSDIPLNATGQQQARYLSGKLAEEIRTGGCSIADLAICSSPLLRASRSASIIAEGLGLVPTAISVHSVLTEISFGRWEGKTTMEVKAAFPQERRMRKLDRWNFCPIGGESYAARIDEVQNFLTTLNRPTVIVSHTGIIRMLMTLLGTIDQKKAILEPISHELIYKWSDGALARV